MDGNAHWWLAWTRGGNRRLGRGRRQCLKQNAFASQTVVILRASKPFVRLDAAKQVQRIETQPNSVRLLHDIEASRIMPNEKHRLIRGERAITRQRVPTNGRFLQPFTFVNLAIHLALD
jgi:hypothetical protein